MTRKQRMYAALRAAAFALNGEKEPDPPYRSREEQRVAAYGEVIRAMAELRGTDIPKGE